MEYTEEGLHYFKSVMKLTSSAHGKEKETKNKVQENQNLNQNSNQACMLLAKVG